MQIPSPSARVTRRIRSHVHGLLAVLFLALGAAVAIAPAASAVPPGADTPAGVPATAVSADSATEDPLGGSAGEAGQLEWRLPLDGDPVITRPFEPPATPYGPGHRGVDLAAAAGAVVHAAGAGTVGYAGFVAGRPVITILHADNLRTTYEPVTPQVQVGEVVETGDPIGTLLPGHPGCPAGACLHWGLIRNEAGVDVYLDPMSLLTTGPIRLYPWLDPPGSGAPGAAAAGPGNSTDAPGPADGLSAREGSASEGSASEGSASEGSAAELGRAVPPGEGQDGEPILSAGPPDERSSAFGPVALIGVGLGTGLAVLIAPRRGKLRLGGGPAGRQP